MKVLEATDISFSYRPDGAPVLRGAGLALSSGECVAISGRNGSGKSTLVGILAGIIPSFSGGKLEGGAPREEARPVCVTQNVDAQVLNDSVREELSFFLKYCETPRFASPEAALAGTGIEPLLEKKTYQLSSGEKQNFVLACALACADGKVLVLDEPSSFLDEQNARLLAARLAALKSAGAGIVIFGHELSALDCVVDRRLLLEDGVLRQVREDCSLAPISLSRIKGNGPVVLSCEGLGADMGGKTLFSNLSFSLRTGSVLGVTGRNGCGKTTLARIISGLEPRYNGRLSWNGAPADVSLLRGKIKLVMNNPYNSLFYRTVRENLESAGGIFPDAAVLKALGLCEVLDRDILHLSWGQAQKAQLLCAISGGAEALVLDECLSAVDSQGIAACSELLSAHCGRGGAAMFISHSAPLVGALCSEVMELGGGEK